MNRVLSSDPENLKALINRGTYYSNLDSNQEAIDDFSAVIRLDSSNTLAYYNRAQTKLKLLKYKSALVDINNAISTKSSKYFYIDKVENKLMGDNHIFDVPMVLLRKYKGMTLYRMNSLNLAYDEFTFCIDKKFDLAEVYYWRGITCLSLGLDKEGCEDLNKAKSLGDKYAEEKMAEYCK